MEPARPALTALFVFAALATTSLAAAREPRSPTQHADPLAEALTLAAAGERERARVKLEEAYANSPTARALFHLARMDHVLGEHALAAQRYRAALADPSLPEELRGEAKSALADVEKRVGVLSLDVPADAIVTVDGSVVDHGAPVEVVPGTHIVKARLGSETASAFVMAPAGLATPVRLRFGAKDGFEGTSATPPALAARWPRAKVGSVLGGAVATAGLLAASGVLTAVADAKRTTDRVGACVDPAAPGCAALSREQASAASARTAARVTLYSGIALGALTATLAVLWPNERVRLGPTSATTSGWSLRF